MKLEIRNNTIQKSSGQLIKLINEIKVPLKLIINENNKLLNKDLNQSNEVIFSSSKEIAHIVDEIVKLANNNNQISKPFFFEIYESNEKVRSMCNNNLNFQKISKQDSLLLMKMENIVFQKIKYEDLNLYNISYELGISERQLYRKIKYLLHLTPNKYIRILRLKMAKQLIDDFVHDSMSQISYAVGYYDTHYFSKLFNQQYGVYPKELLQKNRL